MVKVKLVNNKATIIDDAECTPGQSRQFDLFEFQVMPIFEKNIDLWQMNFKKLDTDFYVDSIIETNDGKLIIFRMNGDR